MTSTPFTATLTAENTNAFAHRIAGDSLVYECPNCAFGEVLLTELIERPDACCLDCGARYRLRVERVVDDEQSTEGVERSADETSETGETDHRE